MNTYHVGQLVHLTFSFAELGVLTDPTAITLTIKDPTGAELTYTLISTTPLVRDGIGLYHLDITATLAGVWSWHCASTGTAQAAGDNQFYVTAALA